jgi:UDP-glucose 4-epimerase
MKNKQKIIVTGGMGYIGSHTVVELVNSGYEPVIFDNLSNSNEEVLQGLEKICSKTIPFIECELRNQEETMKAFNKHNDAEGIIHFAARKSVGESVHKPILYYDNNINSLLNILRAQIEFEIKSLIFSSSCTVYGQASILPVTENTPYSKAESPYGYTKQIGETMICDFIKAHNNFNAISLRYFNPVGAHPSAEIGELPNGKPENLMPYITQTAAGLREQLSIFGNDYNTPDGTGIRDYIHVVDLAQAHVASIKRLLQNKNKERYEYFNLGTGNGFSVLEVIQSFENTSGKKLNYKIVDRRPGDIEKIYASTKLSSEELKWEAKLSLDDMTRTAWQWEKKLRNID